MQVEREIRERFKNAFGEIQRVFAPSFPHPSSKSFNAGQPLQHRTAVASLSRRSEDRHDHSSKNCCWVESRRNAAGIAGQHGGGRAKTGTRKARGKRRRNGQGIDFDKHHVELLPVYIAASTILCGIDIVARMRGGRCNCRIGGEELDDPHHRSLFVQIAADSLTLFALFRSLR